MSQPALFLDRDGVINVDHQYVSKIEDFEFIEGIFALCRHAKERGYLICIVTNQSGIGRGYYTEDDFIRLTDWMCNRFIQEGTPIDKVYFCAMDPEQKTAQSKQDAYFRKPNPGMILQAAQELDIDLLRSVLVGDKETDIQAGIAAKMGCTLLYNSDSKITTAATAVVTNLNQIPQFLP